MPKSRLPYPPAFRRQMVCASPWLAPDGLRRGWLVNSNRPSRRSATGSRRLTVTQAGTLMDGAPQSARRYAGFAVRTVVCVKNGRCWQKPRLGRRPVHVTFKPVLAQAGGGGIYLTRTTMIDDLAGHDLLAQPCSTVRIHAHLIAS